MNQISTSLARSGAVLFGKDLLWLASFYEGVAGLALAHDEPGLFVLESAALQLMLHGIPARLADSIQISSPPALRSQAAVKLVFAVESIAGSRARAAALGGEIKPKKQEFEARGFRACDGHDPEGNVIQLREPVADHG